MVASGRTTYLSLLIISWAELGGDIHSSQVIPRLITTVKGLEKVWKRFGKGLEKVWKRFGIRDFSPLVGSGKYG